MGIMTLWMPILASSVIVFIMSALVWTVLPWHKKDYKQTGDEESVRSALSGNAPGLYVLPYCKSASELKDPDVAQKFVDGPQGFITILPNGMPQMGSKLALSFVQNVLVGVICAYMVSRTLAPEAEYLAVFRIAGTTAFVAYGMGYLQESTWFGRPWSATFKNLFDALLYGVLTGGAFGWLA